MVQGLEFAGGNEFIFPGGIVRSANITPDRETGIGNWTNENIIYRFKSFAEISNIVKVNINAELLGSGLVNRKY